MFDIPFELFGIPLKLIGLILIGLLALSGCGRDRIKMPEGDLTEQPGRNKNE